MTQALADHLPELECHRDRLAATSMRALFAQDADRFETFSAPLDDLLLDYSKTRLDAPALDALLALARDAGVEAAREAMFAGEAINTTEGRAVLHTALRNRSGEPVRVDGRDLMGDVNAVRAAMGAFAAAVRSGEYTVTGGPVTDVINIGIGGSDLGPAMATRALSPYHDGPRAHFVSNVDGAALADCVARLDPATTLFIVASKTFTTAETIANAKAARAWLASHVGEANAGRHFAAVSTNLAATGDFGIDEDRTFGFWDWVGGRYSVWSAVGLSLMIAIGPEDFDRFGDGAFALDEHFRQAPLSQNLPVLLALIGIWHRNVWGYAAHAVLPYDERLARLPAYLQQLEMESNGKRVTAAGQQVTFATNPVIWGEPGTNGQHAFYQQLHQGADIVPCDFLIAASAHEADPARHHMLIANCLAQSQALMAGRSEDEARAQLAEAGFEAAAIDALAAHKTFPGNRPSTTIAYRRLDPFALGRLIALYEHKVFVQGVIWGVNSFDQWGVELGKQLAGRLQPMVAGESEIEGQDGSTAGLLRVIRDLSGG